MRRPNIQRPWLEDIEPRILFSADPLSATVAAAAPGALSHEAPLWQDSAPAQAGRELVLIDGRVPHADMLLADIERQAAQGRPISAILLAPEDDGVRVVSDALAQGGPVSALHLVGHGEPGRLWLGNGALDNLSLMARAGELAAWGDHLLPDADLLIYGCDVAFGAEGAAFTTALAQLTGADVAASLDTTGHHTLGGNWTLEMDTGDIEAQLAFDLQTRALWQGALATYTVTNTNDSGAGSLRQAITDANASGGADIIDFNIAGTGVHTITLVSALPSITGTVVIDATTDDSFAANGSQPAIVLNGNSLAFAGLTLSADADGSTIRGLVIKNFDVASIRIESGSSGNTIAGNYFGALNADGSHDAGAQAMTYLVDVRGDNNVIGGSTAADRNVMINNGANYGVFVFEAGAFSNRIQGNHIGTNAAGNAGFGGDAVGISVSLSGANNLIGGSGAGEGNVMADTINVSNAGAGTVVQGNRVGVSADGTGVLSGVTLAAIDIVGTNGVTIRDNWVANVALGGGGGHGILLRSGVSNTVIDGNRIGTDLAGTANWGVSQSGIRGTASNSNNQITNNTIAHSNQGGLGFDGVGIVSGTGNAILGNSIYGTLAGTGGLGIDLANDGVTANDTGDADTGANNLQNFPVLTLATTDGSNITFTGTLNSTASSYHRIEFFANPAGHSSGYGEGQTYLGFVNVATNVSGNATISTTLTAAVPVGYVISATATRATDATYTSFTDTSEFAANIVTVSSTQAVLVVDTTGDTVDGNTTSISTLLASTGADGRISLREAITAINNTPAGSLPTRIDFNITGDTVHTITLTSALPAITKPVIIDGTTDTGSFTSNGSQPAIVIDVNGLTTTNGLQLTSTADGSTIRGLVILNFTSAGIRIDTGSNGHTIVGNHISPVDGAGNPIATTNGLNSLYVGGANNVIGGTTAADRNVINQPGTSYGILITGAGASGNVVLGNYLGTDVSGTVATTNTSNAIAMIGSASNNTIGGPGGSDGNIIAARSGQAAVYVNVSGAGNVVQGNKIGISSTDTLLGTQASGLRVDSSTLQILNNWIGGGLDGIWLNAATNSTVQGNRIGTDLAGTANWGPTTHGIRITNGNNNLIGGTSPGQGNVIAFFNKGGGSSDGIVVESGTGNALLGNAIYSSTAAVGALGIDLGTTGVTANDAGDVDAGANNLQNFPVLTAATTDGTSVTLTGTLNSTAGSHYRIEFFANATGHASGYGHGQSYLGFVNVATDGSGNATISTTLSAAVPSGYRISATATKSEASYSTFTDTSEFALNITANTPPTTTVPGAQTVAEDTPLAVGGISVNDPDGNLASVALEVDNGTLSVSLAGGATISAGANGSTTLTLSGSQAQINAALGTLSYQGNSNFFGSDTLTVVSTDALGSSDSDTVAITVTPVNDLPVGVPTISGTATEDQTLTADASSITDADGLGAFSYQWLRDGAVISGATSSTYSLGDDDVGANISVTVSYNDGQGTAESVTSAAVGPVTNINDVPVGLPTITGTVTEDQTLTANTSGISDADGLGAFSYQWLRDGAVISGATSSTYSLDDDDVGTQISVTVSYTDGQSTAESVTSAAVGPVTNVNDAPVGLPTITGTVTEDQTLTANTSGISDADGLGAFSYQWLRDGAVISGATGSTYSLGDDDVGANISVTVNYTDGQGTAESVTSAAVGPVGNVNDAPAGLPTISGTPTEDQTLTADASGITDADGLGAFSYQWLRDGAVISGATSSTYTLADADVGTQISVTVSYTDGQGTAESVTSAAVGPVVNVNGAPFGLPLITGSVTEDQTLTADTSAISDPDGLGSFSHQWLRDGAAISGATSSTYILGDADVGTQITVAVSYTDGNGTAESVTSASVGPVANVNDAPIGLPVISGAAVEGQTLTADTSGISDADGLGAYSYQWTRDGLAITGATSATYTVGAADLDAEISVTVSYTDGQGTAEEVSSAPVGPVTNVNQAPVGLPTITGTATEDQTLTADTAGISDADGLGAFAYQWLRDGVAITGANSATYTLVDADVGSQITVTVSYTDGQGTAESLSSAAVGPVLNVNDAPTLANPIADQLTYPNTPWQFQFADNTFVDADAGDSLTYSSSGLPAWLSFDAANRRFSGSATQADVGAITITVRATDGAGAFVETAFTVVVGQTNQAPTVLTLSNSTVDEGTNTSGGYSVGTLSATDPDPGDTLTYSVIGGADASRFSMGGTAGNELLLDDGLLDFASQPIYEVTVRVTDSGGLTHDTTFLISVNQVQSNSVGPVTDINSTANRVDENAGNGSLTGITAFARDDDPGDSVSYSLSDDAGGRFAIDAQTGVVTVANGAALDFESASGHTITVRATSSDGSTASQLFTIAVNDLNEHSIGSLVDANPAANRVTENAANGTPVGVTLFAADGDAGDRVFYSLSNNAGGRFAINAQTGVVTVANGALLDFETATQHTITARASSSDGSSRTLSVTIQVLDANEHSVGVLQDTDSAANQVMDNASAGSTIGLTAFASDADAGDSVSYRLSDDAGGRFTIDAQTGVVTLAEGTVLDASLAASHTVTVVASSSDGSSRSERFDVAVLDSRPPVENRVIEDMDRQPNRVTDLAGANTTVGIRAQITGADPDDTIRYRLLDDAGGRFWIDPVTGTVHVTPGAQLDARSTPELHITVQAIGANGAITSRGFVIELLPTEVGAPDEGTPPLIGATDRDPAGERAPAPGTASRPSTESPTAAEPARPDAIPGDALVPPLLGQTDPPAPDFRPPQPPSPVLITWHLDGGSNNRWADGHRFGWNASAWALVAPNVGTLGSSSTSGDVRVAWTQSTEGSQVERLLTPETIAVASTVVTAGLAWWVGRSGALAASLLASLPAWGQFDPLPVYRHSRRTARRRRATGVPIKPTAHKPTP